MIDPVEVLTKSARDARRTAVRAAQAGGFCRAGRFLRWAYRCEAAIAELKATGFATGNLRKRSAA